MAFERWLVTRNDDLGLINAVTFFLAAFDQIEQVDGVWQVKGEGFDGTMEQYLSKALNYGGKPNGVRLFS